MDYHDEMTEKMSKEDKKAYGDYKAKEQAEEDARILIKAQEIKDDEKRKNMALHCAKQQKKALQSVIGDKGDD